MSNSIQTKKQFVLNSIPNQTLSYANQLTTQQWNTIINTLRTQTNDNTKYLKELHQWLIGFNSIDENSTVPDESSLFKHVMSITNGDRTFSGIKSFTDTIISTTSGNTLCSTSGSLSIRAFNNQSDIGGILIDLHSSDLYKKDGYGNTYYLGVSASGPFYKDTIDRGYKYLAYRDDIPTKVSQLKNDEGYINGVEAQSLIDKSQINPNVYRDTIGSLSNRWSEIYTKYLYSNSVRTNTILPTKTDGTLQSNVSLGDIGNNTYHWFSAYIDNIVSEAITMNGESVATEKYVNDLLANFSSLDLKPVDVLPTEDISTKSIYLLKTRNDESNIYEEYIYVNDNWELIGTTEIDLSAYLKKSGDEITGSIILKDDKGKIINDTGRTLLSYASSSLHLGNPNDHVTISGNNILLSNVHNIKTHASSTDGTYTKGKANQVLATNGFDKTYWTDLPAVNNGTLTIKTNNNLEGTFTANSSEDVEINIVIPTGTAADKNVDDTIFEESDSSNENLPTSKAVMDYVTEKIEEAIGDIDVGNLSDTVSNLSDTVNDHINDKNNPHEVTASQLGLAPVATSGSYNDLIDLPEIPEANDGVLTIQKNSSTLGTFSANSKDNKTINITVPDGEAAYKDVDDAIHIASTDLPTSKAVAEYVNGLLGQITQIDLLPVDELPTEDISTTTIYLLKAIRDDAHNIYEEYIYVNDNWELIGTTEVDLSDYLSLSKGGTVTAPGGVYLENAVAKNSMHITSDSIQSHSYEDDGTTSVGDLNINTQGGNINIGNGTGLGIINNTTNINLYAYATWHNYTHLKPFIDMHVYKANLAASFVKIFSFNLYHYDPTNPTKYFEGQLGFYDNDLTLHVGSPTLAVNYFRIWHEGNLNPSNYVTYEYASRFATKQDINNAISDGVLKDLRDDVTIIEGDLDTARTDIAQIQNKLQELPDNIEDLATQISNKIDKSGGTLTGPLTVTGGNSATAGKIILDQNNLGVITDTGRKQLFGFTETTTLTVGDGAYKTHLWGSSIEAFSTILARAILPVTNNTYNLGSSTNHWKDMYISGKITDGSNSVAISNIVTTNTSQTIDGAKRFAGIVGNVQTETGVYLGIDENVGAPNANIAIASANTAAYIDMGPLNKDYGFRIIKWNNLNGNYDAEFQYGDDGSGLSTCTIKIPRATGTMALTSDLSNYVAKSTSGDTIINSNNNVFRFGGTAGDGTLAVLANTGTSNYLRPGVHGAMDLGTPYEKWKDIYLTGKLTDGSTASIKPSDSNEINFGSNANYIYFGYDNRTGSSGAVSEYYFGTHAGAATSKSGNIHCGNVYINGGANKVASEAFVNNAVANAGGSLYKHEMSIIDGDVYISFNMYLTSPSPIDEDTFKNNSSIYGGPYPCHFTDENGAPDKFTGHLNFSTTRKLLYYVGVASSSDNEEQYFIRNCLNDDFTSLIIETISIRKL